MKNELEVEEAFAGADYTVDKFSWRNAGLALFCGFVVGFFIGVLAR